MLPFLDLTDKMAHEIFADGMTEELIDKFSKIAGLRVAAPRSSFLLKGKSPVSSETGLKYLILGALSSAALLYGISLIYGMSGTTNLTDVAAFIKLC